MPVLRRKSKSKEAKAAKQAAKEAAKEAAAAGKSSQPIPTINEPAPESTSVASKPPKAKASSSKTGRSLTSVKRRQGSCS